MSLERDLSQFSKTYSAELAGRMSRLDNLIGRSHWLTVGEYKESLLRALIAESLPRRFEVSSGFIVGSDKAGAKLLSNQVDILIWDSHEHAPLFRSGDLVVVWPEAVRAAIEVKSTLDKPTLDEALANLDAVHQLVVRARKSSRPNPFTAVFAFDDTRKTAARCWLRNAASFLSRSTAIPVDVRLSIANQHSNDRKSLGAWPNVVVVLDQGAMTAMPWYVDKRIEAIQYYVQHGPGFADDTFGYLMRKVLEHLMDAGEWAMLRQKYPGAANQLVVDAGDWYRRWTGWTTVPAIAGSATDFDASPLLRKKYVKWR